ncbi:MAG: cytochrome c [Planctomycetales bacterium]|nr:cytochrome c [Planctomycetales bacterium]
MKSSEVKVRSRVCMRGASALSGPTLAALAGIAAVCAAPLALGDDGAPTRRAAPPPVAAAGSAGAFFDDARQALVGTRPAAGETESRGQSDGGAGGTSSAADGGGTTQDGKGGAWSRVIEADALLAEIKRNNNELTPLLANASRFKSGAVECRRGLSTLAVWFAVVSHYDDEIRGKEFAGPLAAALAKAARNAKAPTDQSYAEVRRRKADLDDVLRGQAPGLEGYALNASSDEAQRPWEVWSQLADRADLMQRLEIALRDVVGPALANERTFEREADRVAEEAQLATVLARVMRMPDYEFHDDESFAQFARELEQAAIEVTAAARERNYSAARAAAGRVTQSCSDCHEGYRG